MIIGNIRLQDAEVDSESIHAAYGSRRDGGLEIGAIAPDQFSNQRRLLLGESLLADASGKRRISAQRLLRLDQRAHGAHGDLGLLLHEPARGSESAECIEEGRSWAVAASHVEYDCA